MPERGSQATGELKTNRDDWKNDPARPPLPKLLDTATAWTFEIRGVVSASKIIIGAVAYSTTSAALLTTIP